MRKQEPTVLIRVPGTARDQLSQLRQPTGPYSWAPLEAIGAVVARLAAAAAVPKPGAGAGAKPKPAQKKGRVT